MLDIPARDQWEANWGYCGEVALISAGLYYGQYVSQYQIREMVLAYQNSAKFNQTNYESQLLIGVTGSGNAADGTHLGEDEVIANQMHLKHIEWDSTKQKSTAQYLAWVKQMVSRGYPVTIGVLMNQYLFHGETKPKAGAEDYDHIVPVTGIASNHPLSDERYYPGDRIYFSDSGLWQFMKLKLPTVGFPASFSAAEAVFNYTFETFSKTRKGANAVNAPPYSLARDTNYGIAMTGVADLNGDTLPVRVDTDLPFEYPQIPEGSATRPVPERLVLMVTVKGLRPGVSYKLYRYNSLSAVPNSLFNARASSAYSSRIIEIKSGSTFVMKETILSDEIAVYRAVPIAAP